MSTEYGPLQVLPGGLLGLFQIKNAGKYPDTIGSAVQPTIDLTRWYMNYNAQEHALGQVALADNAVGFTGFSPNTITVPEREAWYVVNYSVHTDTMVAAEVSQFSLAWRIPLVGTNRFHLLERTFSTSGPDTINALGVSDFFLPPGSELGLYVHQNDTAATITHTGYVRYVPLAI